MFWPCLFCAPWLAIFQVFFCKFAAAGLRCWNGWAFSNSLTKTNIAGKIKHEKISDKSFLKGIHAFGVASSLLCRPHESEHPVPLHVLFCPSMLLAGQKQLREVCTFYNLILYFRAEILFLSNDILSGKAPPHWRPLLTAFWQSYFHQSSPDTQTKLWRRENDKQHQIVKESFDQREVLSFIGFCPNSWMVTEGTSLENRDSDPGKPSDPRNRTLKQHRCFLGPFLQSLLHEVAARSTCISCGSFLLTWQRRQRTHKQKRTLGIFVSNNAFFGEKDTGFLVPERQIVVKREGLKP